MHSGEIALELCNFDDLEDGQARGFVVPGLRRKVVVVRKAGKVFGYLDSCPHYRGGTPMAWRTDAYLDGEGRHIACHAHGALFDIETGACVLGPCLGQSLKHVPLNINSNGGIEATVDAYREEMA